MKYFIYILLFSLISCFRDPHTTHPAPAKTKNVIIVIMDGARYSETWGDPSHTNIPRMAALASQGVVCTSFWNAGQTVTVAGHTAITTGNYQVINNGGQELPASPSIFQYYRSNFLVAPEDAWVFASKDKLEVLSDCVDAEWKGQFRPRTDCGVNGLNTGYRDDSVTYRHVIDTLTKYHPHLVLINFKEPDGAGHSNNWIDYIAQTKKTDAYIGKLWDFLQGDPAYAGSTAMFVTNDHGRHLDGVSGGFAGHGCTCTGCSHIMLLAVGPDFKTSHYEEGYYTLVDIPRTAALLLKMNFPRGEGIVMTTIFK